MRTARSPVAAETVALLTPSARAKRDGYTHGVVLEFDGEIISWRGPAPFLFVPVPDDLSEEIRAVSRRASYGWGCIPVKATIGGTEFTTSLFPKDGRYLVPVKVVVQRAESVGEGDTVTVKLSIELQG